MIVSFLINRPETIKVISSTIKDILVPKKLDTTTAPKVPAI